MATEKTVGQLMDLVVGPRRPGPESIGLAQMRRVLEHPNIVGIGASRKVTQGKTLKTFAFSVFVVKKVASSRLRETAAVPPIISTGTGQKVVTDVVEIGVLKPEANVRKRPIQPGYSIGHFSGDTGTLGAIVKRDGKYFVLSNSHVLAMCGRAKKGDLIIYPGTKMEAGSRRTRLPGSSISSGSRRAAPIPSTLP